jgi:hypothetical protein
MSRAALKQPRRESKIRYHEPLYRAMERYSQQNGGMSFQQIVEEGLRLLFEGQKPDALARSIAVSVVDEIDQILAAPASYGRRLNALRAQMLKFLNKQQLEERVDPIDPLYGYVARIFEAPRSEQEAALSALIRAMSKME